MCSSLLRSRTNRRALRFGAPAIRLFPLPSLVTCACAAIAILAIPLVGRADEPLGPAELARRVGETCLGEISVVSVKHSQRRTTHFLSSTANLHRDSALSVAIRDDAMPRFRAAGIDELDARYLGRTIRARGKVARDEGQLLLVVSSPEDIEIVNGAAQAAGPGELLVINDAGQRTALKLSLPDDHERKRVTVEIEGKPVTYEGVPLSTVLSRANVKLGAEARGALMARYVLLTAADGYRVVLSISEVDPFLTDQVMLLADRRDGEPLPEAEGPLRLVVAADKRHRRWIRQVSRIEVRSVAADEAGPKPSVR